MNLESRISRLTQLLQKHSIEEINQMYRDAEYKMAMEGFEKYPDVRYSDNMKKRIVREARSKKIRPGRLHFIESIIEKCTRTGNNEVLQEIRFQSQAFVYELDKHIQSKRSISLIFLEHDFEASKIDCIIYASSELREDTIFRTPFNFTSIWGYLTTSKFSTMAEQLEVVEIEDEEYPQILYELSILRSYELTKIALNNDSTDMLFDKHPELGNACIEIGQHDNWKYEIYRAK